MPIGMKCMKKNCDGIVHVEYNYTRPNGDRIRKRVCDTCGETMTTIEVPKEKYERMRRLFAHIITGMKEYF